MQRLGIGRQRHPSSSGSTPHDRVTVPQICSSRSPLLNRPRHSAVRYPPVVANHPTTCGVRHHTASIHQRLHRCTSRWIGSIQISKLARGAQIPITPAAPPHVSLSAVSSLGGFRTPAAEHVAPSLKRPASETLHKSGKVQTEQNFSGFCLKADARRLRPNSPRISPRGD